jgi:hypothetical protein
VEGLPKTTNWAEFHRRDRMAKGWLVVGLPVMFLVGYATSRLLAIALGTVLVALSLPWSIVFAWFAFRLVRFPCPKCGVPFLAPQEFRFDAHRRCLNCGLGLHEEL